MVDARPREQSREQSLMGRRWYPWHPPQWIPTERPSAPQARGPCLSLGRAGAPRSPCLEPHEPLGEGPQLS